MDLLKRVVSLCQVRLDPNYAKRGKQGDDGLQTQFKTKSQLEFEEGIDEKPVITDVK